MALAGITFAGLFLRSVFPRALGLAWSTPDLLLLLVVFNAMFRGARAGGVVGFLVGLTEDFYFGRFIGLNALAKCVAGAFAGHLGKQVFKENMWVPVICVLAASFLNIAIVFLAGILAGARWHLGTIFYQSVFEIIVNVCLVPFLYGPFFHFADRCLGQPEVG